MGSLNQWAGVWADFMLMRVGESTLVFAVVGLIWLMARKRVSPQFGYVLFLLPLIKLVFWIPVELPVWMAQWSPPVSISETIPAGLFEAEPLVPLIPDSGSALESGAEGATSDSTILSLTGLEPSFPANVEKFVPASTVSFTPPTATALVFLLWLLIAGFLAMKYLFNQYRFRQALKSASPIGSHYGSIDLNPLRRQAGVQQTVRFVMSSSVNTPVVWGIWRPHLILPSHFGEGFTPDQMKWILLHELAHIRRWDLLAALFQRGVGMLFFFHPVVWITNRTLDRLREYACDDMALVNSGISRLECGEGFLAVAEQMKLTPAYADALLGFMGEHSSVWRRMMRILDGERKLHMGLSFSTMGLLLLVALLVLPSVRAADNSNDADSSQTVQTDPDQGKTGVLQKSAEGDVIQESTASSEIKTATETEPPDNQIENETLVTRGFMLRQYPQDIFPSHWLNLISPLPTNDGRYAVGYYYKSGDEKTGDLIFRDIKTRKDVFLTNEGFASPDYSAYERLENSAISPDVKTVAYSWGIKKSSSDYHAELRLVNTDGTNQRTLLAENNLITSVIGWTQDGKSLFCQLRWNEPLRIEFALVSIKDGSIKILRTVTDPDSVNASYVIGRYPQHYTFLSPDEKYIAYTYYPDPKDDWNSDIAIWSVEEQKEYLFVVHPAKDNLFGWSPDGKWIVFSSNRLSTNDIYLAPFSLEGKTANPTIATRGLGQIHPIGITTNGRMYFSEAVNLSDVYTATIDWNSKTIEEDSEPISTSIKSPLKGAGKWSPDGKLCILEVYEADFGVDDEKSFWIYSDVEKSSYEIPMNVKFEYWSSFESWGWYDNDHIIGTGKKPSDSQPRLYKINIKSGDTAEILWEEPYGLWGVRSHDLKKYYSTKTKDNTVTLYEYNRETKEDRILYENVSEPNTTNRHFGFKLSPDEKELVCWYYEQSSDTQSTHFASIRIVSIENGKYLDIYKYDSDKISINDIRWMPDSKSILFVQKDEDYDEDECSVVKVDITGESSEIIGKISDSYEINVHPSGNKISYTKQFCKSFTWMMEDFLPEEAMN